MRLIDADQMALDESEVYTKAQTSGEVSPITFGINSVVHRKIQQLIADTPTVDAIGQFTERLIGKAKSAKERFLLKSLVESVKKEMGVGDDQL